LVGNEITTPGEGGEHGIESLLNRIEPAEETDEQFIVEPECLAKWPRASDHREIRRCPKRENPDAAGTELAG
jgi:hypothetical protein